MAGLFDMFGGSDNGVALNWGALGPALMALSGNPGTASSGRQGVMSAHEQALERNKLAAVQAEKDRLTKAAKKMADKIRGSNPDWADAIEADPSLMAGYFSNQQERENIGLRNTNELGQINLRNANELTQIQMRIDAELAQKQLEMQNDPERLIMEQIFGIGSGGGAASPTPEAPAGPSAPSAPPPGPSGPAGNLPPQAMAVPQPLEATPVGLRVGDVPQEGPPSRNAQITQKMREFYGDPEITEQEAVPLALATVKGNGQTAHNAMVDNRRMMEQAEVARAEREEKAAVAARKAAFVNEFAKTLSPELQAAVKADPTLMDNLLAERLKQEPKDAFAQQYKENMPDVMGPLEKGENFTAEQWKAQQGMPDLAPAEVQMLEAARQSGEADKIAAAMDNIQQNRASAKNAGLGAEGAYNKAEGTILVDDPSAPGGKRIVPIEGGKAAIAAQEEERARTSGVSEELRKNDVVKNAIGDIRKVQKTAIIPPVGFHTNIPFITWTTPGMNDIRQSLVAVKSNIVIDKLNAMRAASTTGASGLGQVTEKEVRMLESALGTIEQSLSPELFNKNLTRIEKMYDAVVNGTSQDEIDTVLEDNLGAMKSKAPEKVAAPAMPKSASDAGITQEMWDDATPDERKAFQ